MSPQDLGLGSPLPTVQEPVAPSAALSGMDAAPEAALLPVSCEDGEEDEEGTEALETSLASLDAGQDDEEDDVFTLDAPMEDMDEDDEDNVLEDEEDNVFEDEEM